MEEPWDDTSSFHTCIEVVAAGRLTREVRELHNARTRQWSSMLVLNQSFKSVCLLHVGVVPVTVRPPQAQNISTTLPTVHMIITVSKAAAVLSTSFVLRLLKSKVQYFLLDLFVLDMWTMLWKSQNKNYYKFICEFVEFLR